MRTLSPCVPCRVAIGRVLCTWVCDGLLCQQRQARAVAPFLLQAASIVLTTVTVAVTFSSVSVVAIAIIALITLIIVAMIESLSRSRQAAAVAASVFGVVAAFIQMLCRLSLPEKSTIGNLLVVDGLFML